MLVIEQFAAPHSRPQGYLVLTYEFRCKNRLRTRLESGEEVGLFLERGTILRHDQLLLAHDGRVVQVKAAPEALLEVRSDDALALMHVAYHLGNRHVALQLQRGLVRFLADHVLAEMVRGLGLEAHPIHAPFQPEGGAYGNFAAHHHGPGPADESHQARIHDMSRIVP